MYRSTGDGIKSPLLRVFESTMLNIVSDDERSLDGDDFTVKRGNRSSTLCDQ
jgi:hypothetical protein